MAKEENPFIKKREFYQKKRQFAARECFVELFIGFVTLPLQRLLTIKQTAIAVNSTEIRRLQLNESTFSSFLRIYKHTIGKDIGTRNIKPITMGYRSLLVGGYCIVPITMGTYLGKKFT